MPGMVLRSTRALGAWARRGAALPSRWLCSGGNGNTSNVTSALSPRLQAGPTSPPEAPLFLAHPRTCGLVGMPFSWGRPRAGVENGPQLLRNRGVDEVVMGHDWRLEEHGDVSLPNPTFHDNASSSGLKNSFAVGEACRLLAVKVERLVADGKFPLVMGGDHSIALGSLAGILRHRPDTVVFWVDAHADINTPETSPSGNLNGMPLAFLMGLVEETISGYEWLDDFPRLQPEQLVYVGLRDVDPGERKTIRNLGIAAYTMHEVDRYGIGQVMEHALRKASPKGDRPIHLSFDIDAVDPEPTEGEGEYRDMAQRGGFSLREGHFIAERLAATGMLGSMDIVEVNQRSEDLVDAAPGRYVDENECPSAELGVQLVASAMGNAIL